MAPSSESSSAISLLVSAGLFLTTALLSQILQHHYLQQSRNCGNSNDKDDDFSDLDDSSYDRRQEREHQIKIQRQRLRRHREQQQLQLYSSHRSSQQQQQQPQQQPKLLGGDNHNNKIHKKFHRTHNNAAADVYSNDTTNDDIEKIACQQSSDTSPTAQELAEFRDCYRFRRLEERRLSFQNLHTNNSINSDDENDSCNNNDNIDDEALQAALIRNQKQRLSFDGGLDHSCLNATTTPASPSKTQNMSNKSKKKHQHIHHNHIHHHHRKNKSSNRRRLSVLDQEDENDFRPKNSNWNHFERYNEDDIKNGLIQIPINNNGTTAAAGDDDDINQESAQYQHDQHHSFQPFSNGYMHETESLSLENAAVRSCSDTSEEPQFVWTDAVHEKKRLSSNNGNMAVSLALQDVDPLEQKEGCDPAMTMPTTFTTLEPSVEAELPSRNLPKRIMTTSDSVLTVPTDNMEKNCPIVDQNQRQFFRHSSTLTSNASPLSTERIEIPPQRFPSLDNKSSGHLEGEISTSEDYINGNNSDVSGISTSSQNKQTPVPTDDASHRKLKYTKESSTMTDSKSHRSARAQYNAKIMPNKVVMIRHGQSMGNIDESLYSTTPDNAMPLTKLGWDQARKAGKHLKAKVLAENESVHFIVSPYARTVETFHGIVSAWCDPDGPEFATIPNREMRLKAWYGKLLKMGLTWHEDPRIREQDFGNYQDPERIKAAKRDRHRFGIFYYRFPHGESASDVFDRVSTFLDSLWRSFDMNRSRNYVLVTHGISVRVLLARYFRYTIHQFNMLVSFLCWLG